MHIVKHENAEKILKMFVPENILKLNPVIAGGFIVSLYQDIMCLKNPAVKEKLEQILNSDNKASFDNFKIFEILNNTTTPGNTQIEKTESFKFGDIDLWFMEDNVIWDAGNSFYFLVGDHEVDPPSKNHKIYGCAPTFYQSGAFYKDRMDVLGLDSIHSISNSTSWANTFRSKKTNGFCKPIQAIKKKIKDIQTLFDTFDILNCCAAYYNGSFYFADGLEQLFQERLLAFGNVRRNSSVIGKIWAAERAFKYSKRYKLQFDKNTCEEITQIFYEAEDLNKKIKSGKEADLEISKSVVEVEDAYGRTIFSMDRETLSNVVNNFLFHFKDLISMEYFNENYIFTFLNSTTPSVLEEVKNFVEIQGRLARGEGESKEVTWKEDYV
jgi:hypothetical protein